MDDSTTTPTLPAVPESVVPDRRTARRLALAEQQHRNADAELERRRRAALQELELRDARAEAARRKRDSRRRQVQARRNARKARRTAWRTRVRAAVPRWAERALFVGPILFPMAVAWVGQVQYARTVMGWPLAGAIVFAAGFELSTVYVARLDWKARGEGDNSMVFRAATWMFAALAGTMNYWHAADPGFRPNGEAVSYGAMSIAGVMLWELLSTYRHRSRLRGAGKLPPRRPRFGLARWTWFPRIAHLARLLALRDGHKMTEHAWKAALDAAHRHGSVRAAVAALRGRGGVRLDPDATHGEIRADTADETQVRWLGETAVETTTQPASKTALETAAASKDETPSETDQSCDAKTDRETASAVPVWAEAGSQAETRLAASSAYGDSRRSTANGHRAKHDSKGATRRPGGIKTQMIRYAVAQRRAGKAVTGADLDRRYGTVNYGSRVLRELNGHAD